MGPYLDQVWLSGLSQDLQKLTWIVTTEIGNWSILITRGEDEN